MTAYWLMIFWLFAVGGAIGSFMNVVVYRLPLGISLVHPPSHCPKCSKRIPWYDNIPIFGWIMLRGRCRQCHDAISARYPLVEAITAAMFGVLAIVELDQLSTTYPIHLLLLCTLLCAGLIEYDGNRPPVKLFLPALVVGLWASLLWSQWRPIPALLELPTWLYSILFALGIPAWIAMAVWASSRSQAPTGPFLGLVCVGLCLGWKAACVIATAAVVLHLLFWLLGYLWPRLRIPASMTLGVVTLVWIVAWAGLVSP
jgi:leader peptidase (prepilin peptidase) / N-methyltransferase